MKTLYDLIGPLRYDCHVHLFDIHHRIVPCEKRGVGFPDISMRTEPELYTREAVIDMYEKNINIFPEYTILATAVEPQTAIDVLEKFNLRGFGELKCYTETKDGKPLPYKSEKYWRSLFVYANTYKLPVWIHWSLLTEDDYYNLQNILIKYPKAKFVICHCGIDGDTNIIKAGTTAVQCFQRCLKLLEKFPNVYCDVSWKGAKFFIDNPQYHLPEGKYIIGSDINPHDHFEDKVAEDENLYYYEKIRSTMANTNILNIL